MTMLGADLDRLTELAMLCRSRSRDILEASAIVSGRLSATNWRGRNAGTFRSHWATRLRPDLQATGRMLNDTSRMLFHHVAEQRAASRTGGAVLPVVPDFVDQCVDPTALGSPGKVREWWYSIPQSERDRLMETNPELLADLDGVPTEVRYQANKRLVEEAMERLLEESHRKGREVDRLYAQLRNPPPSAWNPVSRELWKMGINRQITHALNERRDLQRTWANLSEIAEHHQVISFDYDKKMIAVVHGDLDNARDVHVLVPGTGKSLVNVDELVGDGRRLLGKPPREGGAVISALMWNPPDGVLDNGLYALHERSLRNDRFDDLLRSMGDRRVVLVGHSAGAGAVQGYLALGTGGRHVDAVVLLGTPRLDEGFITAMGDRHVYVSVNQQDPINNVFQFEGTQYDRALPRNVRIVMRDVGGSWFIPKEGINHELGRYIDAEREAMWDL